MSAEDLKSRLEGLKRTGHGRYIARCPGHADKSPSLSLRELDDGRTLLHCFAGCSVEEVLSAVGMTFSDLYPPRPVQHAYKGERRPFMPQDVFSIARHEIAVAWLLACDMNVGKRVSEEDFNRLGVAVSRLEHIVETCYAR